MSTPAQTYSSWQYNSYLHTPTYTHTRKHTHDSYTPYSLSPEEPHLEDLGDTDNILEMRNMLRRAQHIYPTTPWQNDALTPVWT